MHGGFLSGSRVVPYFKAVVLHPWVTTPFGATYQIICISDIYDS